MEPEYQESPVNRKVLALVAVVLALILVAFCYIVFLLIRNRQAAQPVPQQLPPQQIPLPAIVKRVNRFLPVAAKPAAPAPAPAPTAQTVQTSTLWRFISIDDNNIGTFENVGNPSQKLTASCLDIKRPAPSKGELYTLDDSGILKPQDGRKKFQRFEVITGK